MMKYLLPIILFLSLTASAQDKKPNTPDEVPVEPPKCVHKDEDEFYSSLEHTPPMRLLMIDGKTATLSRTTKFEIKYLHLAIELKNFRAPKDVYQISKDKTFLALYCRIHKVLFVLEPIPKK